MFNTIRKEDFGKMQNNHTHDTPEQVLDMLSMKKTFEFFPVITYVAAMMVFGLIGNILVCCFYGKKSQTTATTRLIVAVAITDSVVCVLMPKNIAVLCLSYRGYSSVLCRINVFINHLFAIGSGLLLIAIASFRYRAVCKHAASQFNVRHANIAIVMTIVFALSVSVPVLFIYETVNVNFTLHEDYIIAGYDCNASPTESLQLLNLLVSGLHFLIFVAATVTFIILYSIIGVRILKYYKTKRRLISSSPSREQSSITNFTQASSIDMHSNTSNREKIRISEAISLNKIKTCKSTDLNCDLDKKSVHSNSAVRACGFREHNNHVIRKEAHVETTLHIAIRQAVMLLVITAIFVLSFLPYLAMNIFRTVAENRDPNEDFETWVKFCQNSYLLNSASNPFVYGFFSIDFRNFVKQTLCRPFKYCIRK